MVYGSEPLDILPCPFCGQPTDSLKQYRYINWCVFLGFAVFQHLIYRACPSCMRVLIWNKCLSVVLILTANVLWLLVFLPWAVILTIASGRPGHSREILAESAPSLAAQSPSLFGARDATNDVSWARVTAVLSLLLFWLPVLGLITGLLAWFLNRKLASWTRWASRIGLALTALVHLGLVAMFLMLTFNVRF